MSYLNRSHTDSQAKECEISTDPNTNEHQYPKKMYWKVIQNWIYFYLMFLPLFFKYNSVVRQ